MATVDDDGQWNEALRRIRRARETGDSRLNLGGLGLSVVPDQIGRLQHLTWLDLDNNRLTRLPEWIADLRSLRLLDLTRNLLSDLPAGLTRLSALDFLALGDNRIERLPWSLTAFPKLERLYLWGNPWHARPEGLASLQALRHLSWGSSGLDEVPEAIRSLARLEELYLEENHIQELPTWLSELPRLNDLLVDDNPLRDPPPEVVEQGTGAILNYLRERHVSSKVQWVSKLVLVGEGGAGKTSFLHHLLGKQPPPDLETTHGIAIEPVALPHPTLDDVEMTLRAWDFGGQEIYHATHQFFLTNRSLFVLVWNARLGYEQAKLYYWLESIHARAPDSPVLLLATHTDERDADLPLGEIRKTFPQVIGALDVSNRDRDGIDDAIAAVARAAADLPLMGEKWPTTWLQASRDLDALEDRHVLPERLFEVMAAAGVKPDGQPVLARWLHELGDLLYFDDDELRGIVILRPQWVTEHISRVLESEDVIERDGIFRRAHMDRLWRDLPPYLRDHFLKLMERFDLSYRTLENQEISLVVERLPLDKPTFDPGLWPEQAPGRAVCLNYRLATLPPGIPTWFIARTHRFTTHTHWRRGAVFADGPQRAHTALIQAFEHERVIRLTVRGPSPHNFLALLRDGLDLTLSRYPGLAIKRMVPCPGHGGEPCCHEFDLRQLGKALEQRPPVKQIQCPESFEPVSVAALVFGLDWRTRDVVLERLDAVERNVLDGQQRVQDQLAREMRDLRALAQRQFTALYHRAQADVDASCPNVFALRPLDAPRWKAALAGEKMQLQLYCQHPGHWHPTADGGRYTLDEPAKWLRAVGPYVARLCQVLRYAVPLIAPTLGVLDTDTRDLIKDDVKLMDALVKKLPDVSGRATHRPDLEGDGRHAAGAELRAIRALLEKKDPDRAWGRLRKRHTPEGHILWLCPEHYRAYDEPPPA